jgi:micrococcal nuclease
MVKKKRAVRRKRKRIIKKKRPTGFVYNAEVLRVIDGDTFELRIDLGFKIIHENTFRLYGVNTPEIRGKERPEGLKVKKYVKELIEGKIIVVETFKKGKFGRYVSEIYLKGKRKPLSKHLLRKKMAKKIDY